MKTYSKFISECNNLLLEKFYLILEKLNKTFDEDAHAKVWNYFISNPEYTEVRDALKSGNKDRALELMKAELERARGDSEHPLNFTKADDSEFSMTGTGKNKRANREDSDREQFDAEIEKAIGGVTSLATQKKFKDAVEKGFPARKTGASKAELSKTWSSAGGTNTTPKADLEVYDPDNEKNRRGISLKKAGGSQIASAEAGELQGTYKAAAKSFVQRFYGDKSREERKRIEREINDDIRRVADINDQARTANNDEKEQLKNSGQEILDKIHDKYPNLTRLVTQVSTTGDKKFRGKNAPGSAGTIVTGDKAKPAQEQPSARPRNAKPKGKGRPANVKIDNKEAPIKSNQAQPQQGPITKTQFDRRARIAALRLQQAETERSEAERIFNDDGTEVRPQHKQNKLNNNPMLARQYAERKAAADQNLQAAQANLSAISQPQSQPQQQTTPQQSQQPPQTQQPQPQTSQQTTSQPSPEDAAEKRRKEVKKRLDSASKIETPEVAQVQ